MKYVLFMTFLLAWSKADTQDSDLLEKIYHDINIIYKHFIQKRTAPINLNKWQFIMEASEIQPVRPLSAYYDFIVVGSGSAGCVVANRLSEIPHWNVLLLEAGKGENLFSLLPLGAPALQFTHYNWGYFAEYQPHMNLGLNRHLMHWPRGRALGGTTVMNYMIYTRGNRNDYDRWAASGNPGWSYRDVLPYYIKSEDAKLKEADYRYHGVGGYLSVEDSYQSQLVRSFIEGGQELGYPHIDYNANVESFGFSTVQATLLEGRRHTHARAFLHPVRHRPNLHILTSAYVTKVLIDPDSREAYGVEYERFGEKYRVGAKKEVVLSAGTFNSPQLLMLAGIGPAEHLRELGIPVLQDLPVGQNMHDHLTYVGLNFLLNQELSLSAYRLMTKQSIAEYLKNGTGPYSSLGGVEGIGYIKTDQSDDPADIPDIELIFIGGSLSTDYGIVTRRGMNIRDDVYNGLFAPTHNIPSWTIFPMMLHPRSIGFLKLKSKNPYDYPLFYPNYFTDPEDHDVSTFLAAIRFIQKLSRTEAFRRFGSKLNPNPVPGCEAFIFDSDDYWRCCIRSLSVTLHHQVGTAKMGPSDDPGAVVNNELKVYGVGKLRVADCSVVPFALGAHTSAVATMVGEKAADMIKQNWGEL